MAKVQARNFYPKGAVALVLAYSSFGLTVSCKSGSDKGSSDGKGATVASNDPQPDNSNGKNDKDDDLNVDVQVPMGLVDLAAVNNVINGMPATLAQGRVIEEGATPVIPSQERFPNRLVGTAYHDNIDRYSDPYHLERVLLTIPSETIENVFRELKHAQLLVNASTGKDGWLGSGNLAVNKDTKSKTFKLAAVTGWATPPEYAVVSYDESQKFPYIVDFYQHANGYVTTDVERAARLEFRKLPSSEGHAEIRVLQSYIPKDWPLYRYYSTISWQTDSNSINCIEGWDLNSEKERKNGHTFQEKYVTQIDLTDTLVKAYGAYRWRSDHNLTDDPWVLDYRLSEAADGYLDLFAAAVRRDGLQEGVQEVASYSPEMAEADGFMMKASSFDATHGDYYTVLLANMLKNLRDVGYNAACGTLGDTIKGSFADLSAAPASIQALPSDLCLTNVSFSDSTFNAALREMCLVDAPPIVAVGLDTWDDPLLGHRNDDIPLDLCERYIHTEITRNAQDLEVVDGKLNVLLYSGSPASLLTKTSASTIHAGLAKELKTITLDMSALKKTSAAVFDVPKKKETDLISALVKAAAP